MSKSQIVFISIAVVAVLLAADKLVFAKHLIVFNNVVSSSRQACIQVVTPAVGPKGICKEFPTPCDVPTDWIRIDKCSDSIRPSPIAVPKPSNVLPIVQNNDPKSFRQEISIKELKGHAICKEFGKCSQIDSKGNMEVNIKSAMIIEIGENLLMISVLGYDYKLDVSDSKIIRNQGMTSSIDEFSIGDIVNIYGILDVNDNYHIHAKLVKNLSLINKQIIVRGSVSEIPSTGTFILRNENNIDYTITVPSDTAVTRSGIRDSLSNMKEGDSVMIRGSKNGSSKKVNAQVVILEENKDVRPAKTSSDTNRPRELDIKKIRELEKMFLH